MGGTGEELVEKMRRDCLEKAVGLLGKGGELGENQRIRGKTGEEL